MGNDGGGSLSAAVDQFLAETWKRNPVWATAYGIHDYDDQLGDLNRSAIEDDIDWLKGEKSRFEGMDPSSLSREDADDLKLVIATIRTHLLAMDERRTWEMNPVSYPELCTYGLYLSCVREYAPLEERLRSVVQRLAQVDRVLGEGKTNLTNPPPVWTGLAVETSEGAVGFLKNTLPPLFEKVPALKKDFEDASTKALTAIEDYVHFLKEDLTSRSTGTYALGKDRFDFLLREDHMLEHDAESLLAFGEHWIGETEKNLTEVAGQIDKEKSWRDLIEEYKSDHPEPEELLDFYRDNMERAKQFVIGKGLVTIQEGESLEVVETPQFERVFLPYAAYMSPAPFEKEQKGLFFVTPIDEEATEEQRRQQLKGHNRYHVAVVALHEAYPGHHLQMTRAYAHPSKMRRLYRSNVFVEGWALYCEEMMYEQGFYPDAVTRLFQIRDTLWRACRVVLDVKLHLGLISFDGACDFLVEKAGLERFNAEKEVSRYTLSPTQPMSYLVGREEIRRLRRDAEKARPEGFELSRFHDWLLSHGSVPVGLISAGSFFP